MFGIEDLLIAAAGGGKAPDAALRPEVDVLAIGRFDGLAGIVLRPEGLRIASCRRGLPDLAARLEVDPLAIVRKGGVPGVEQDAGRLIPRRRGEGEDLLAVIAGGVEEERFAVGRPAQAADALVLEVGDLHAIVATGIADVDLVAAGWIADVGDPRTVGRPHGVDLAPGGAEERALFDGIGGTERGEPDGGRRGTVGVNQAIASNGWIVGLVARDGGIARAAAGCGYAPEPPPADAMAGVEQVLSVAAPGDAANAASVESEAAQAATRGVAQIDIGAVVGRVAHERDAGPGG